MAYSHISQLQLQTEQRKSMTKKTNLEFYSKKFFCINNIDFPSISNTVEKFS